MSRVAMSYDVTTTSRRAPPSTSAAPGEPRDAVMRDARAATARTARSPRTHCLTTLIGQTTSVGPSASAPNSSRSEASIAIACTVLPRPMSSARIAPTPRSPSIRSQPWPRSWKREELERASPPASAAAGSGGRRRRGSSRERRVERDLAELEPGLVRLEPRDRADEVDDPRAAAAALEEAQRALDLRAAQRVPAAGDADERVLRLRELGELLLAERDVADREPPVERAERRRREQPARADRRVAARRASGSRAAGSARAATRSAAGPARRAPRAAASPRAGSARPRRRRARLGRPRAVELDAVRRRAAARSPRAAGSSALRGSLARRNEKMSSPPSHTSDAGRLSVGSSSACSHSSSTSARARSSAVPLVEVQARASSGASRARPRPSSTQRDSCRSSAA